MTTPETSLRLDQGLRSTSLEHVETRRDTRGDPVQVEVEVGGLKGVVRPPTTSGVTPRPLRESEDPSSFHGFAPVCLRRIEVDLILAFSTGDSECKNVAESVRPTPSKGPLLFRGPHPHPRKVPFPSMGHSGSPPTTGPSTPPLILAP